MARARTGARGDVEVAAFAASVSGKCLVPRVVVNPFDVSYGLSVVVESAGKACALAHMWLTHDDAMNTQDFIYITVSDGVGTGLVVDGRLVSGHGGTAGEFGHMALSLDGPRCACGSNGCW